MVLLILLVFEMYYFGQHHELWWPGHELPAMVQIPESDFAMGSQPAEVEDAARWAKQMKNCKDCEPYLYQRETPLRQVHLSSFYIDAREVTNEDVADWLNHQKSIDVDKSGREVYIHGQLIADLVRQEEKPEQRYRGIQWTGTRFHVLPGMARKPAVLVTWDGALRYCQEHGKRLPTESEWELAARGPERRRFPWGDDDPGCADAVFDWSKSALKCRKASLGPMDVGTTPKDRTPLGVYDLAGNVAEWVMDAYREHYLACPAGCRDPIVDTDSPDPAEAGRRVVRGGSWFTEVDATRGASRSRDLHNHVTGDTGFRCVRPTNSKF